MGKLSMSSIGHPHGHGDRPADARVFLGWTDLTTRPAQEFIKMTPGNAAHPSNEWHSRRRHRLLVRTPLIANDEPVGTLCLAFTNDEPLDTLKLELCNAVAQQATLALQLARLPDQASQADVARERETTILQERTDLPGRFTTPSPEASPAPCCIWKHCVSAFPGANVSRWTNRALRKIAALGLAEARRIRTRHPPARTRWTRPFHRLATAHRALRRAGLARLSLVAGRCPRPLPAIADEALLNIAHEAVSNAIRHADAFQYPHHPRFRS